MSKNWAGGSNRAWRQLRAQVILRDGGLCQLQLDGCTTYATTVHHTQPWTGRPQDTPIHLLVAACANCNMKAGEPTGDPTPTPRTQW